MPGPMVLVRVMARMNCPLAPGGRARWMASTTAARFSSRASVGKDSLPMGTCSRAVRSRRNSTRPCLASRMARGRSSGSTTVPALGLGMRPLGPRMRPRRETLPMTSRVARATSNSSQPPSMRRMRSSLPTWSAPASWAMRAASPSAKTSTRTCRPRPWGSTTELRSCWSAWRGSRVVRTCSSTVSSKRA